MELPLRRVFSMIEPPDSCWIWTGQKDRYGYGKFPVWRDGKNAYVIAHRLVFEQTVGPIPEGLEIDHLCRNRACVNPWHLEPVTHLENVRRGVSPAALAAQRDMCAHGHKYDAVWGGQRVCKQCYNERRRARRNRNRAVTS